MHSGLLAVGIVLLVIGLGASFYYESKSVFGIEYQRIYPYQNIGIALLAIGALLIALGALSRGKSITQELEQIESQISRGRFCSKCGKLVPAESKYCLSCGTELEAD